jgi:hypothetical protein
LFCTTANGQQSADIVFRRPNPEALFKIRDTTTDPAQDYLGQLVISTGFTNGMCRSVLVEKSGAVQVVTDNCN